MDGRCLTTGTIERLNYDGCRNTFDYTAHYCHCAAVTLSYPRPAPPNRPPPACRPAPTVVVKRIVWSIWIFGF